MINLNDDYFITADSYCFTLKRRGTGKSKKTGEPIATETNVGYYSSVSNAIKGAIKDSKLREAQAKNYDLNDWLIKSQTINESFENILRKVLKEI